MKTKLIAFLIMISFFPSILFAANETATVTLKGRVVDENDQPVEYANAALINTQTKTIVKGDVCNKQGEFIINKVEKGDYILTISMLGFQKFETERVVVDGNSKTIERKIVLQEHAEELAGVEIVGNKQFVEQTTDKMIINPEASPTSASENVFEILAKIPGVSIDNSDNITLKGMQGVKVLIDDKPTYVSSSQLASLLKGIQGKNVERIEIIENPSARYDAEGNSGVINIKTKINKAPGFNGNVNGGIAYSSRLRWNGGLDLNLKYGKFNIYTNLSQFHWAGTQEMTASRRFTGTALAGAYQLIDNQGEYAGNSFNYKVGVDFYPAKNHVLSLMYRGNAGGNDNSENNSTSFTDKFKNIDSTLVSVSESDNGWRNQTINMNYKWDIDSTGKSLTFDTDIASFKFKAVNGQDGSYINPQKQALGHGIVVDTEQGSDISVISSRMDFNWPVSKKLNIETGLKASFVNNESDIQMSGFLTQNDLFIYHENIQAAYVNAKTQFGKTSLQLGLRLENTLSKGESVLTNQINDTSYLKLFPSVFVQQTLNDKNTLNFRYSYRIGRPGYHHLNPFRWMLDPYTYNVGNPFLKPQFTNTFNVSHSYAGAFITSVGLNYTSGLFTQIIRQDDASKTVYQTMENLHDALDMNLSETVQLKPFKWWRLNGTLTGMYKRILMKENDTESLERFSMNANLANFISLPKKIDLEVSGRYASSQLISNIIVRPTFTLDIGLQKKIFKDKGSIKLAVNDVFKTASGGAYARFGNVDIDVMSKWDSRRVNLTFNYRFGKDEFKTRANRSTSSSEEESRSSR